MPGEAAAYRARWMGPISGPSAPQRHNWIIRRAPFTTVSGDLPGWGLLGIERAPRVDPELIVFALLRAGLRISGATRWLDAADEVTVEYLPWRSLHRLVWNDGLALTVECTAWEERGCVLRFSGALPAAVELLLELRALGRTTQSGSSSFVNAERVRWLERSQRLDGGQAALAAEGTGHRLSTCVSVGTWVADGQVLLCRAPISRQAVELVLAPGGSDGCPGYAAAEAATRARHLRLLAGCRSRTPDPVLDAALEAAVITLDQVRDGSAWLEGITRWNTYWADNYQIGACVAMGRFIEAREALLALAAVERGPGQVLFADGTATAADWGWDDDALPYFILQWQRYTDACDDDLATRLAGPLAASLERFARDRDHTGSGLAGWHLGCNSFLYQADHLSLPGAGFSPSLMLAMMHRALGRNQAADRLEGELLRRFWDGARGAFIPGIDQHGLAQRLALYTDFVFPALYGQLPRSYAWCSLEAADRRLWTSTGLFRMGELLPSGFGNDMVGVVQPSEAAEAYAELGRPDRCLALLERTAEALTTRTDCPGSAPENCDDTGFGLHAYGFGNPAGAVIQGVIQGLWGIYRIDGGGTLRWRPALPGHWPEASLTLADLTASCRGGDDDRTYVCSHARPRRLRLELHCAAHEEFAVRDADGRLVTVRYEAQPCGRRGIIDLPKALEHRLTVLRLASPGLALPPDRVEGIAVDLALPPGDWVVDQAGEVLTEIAIAGGRLRGRLAAGPQPAGFWLVERGAGRAFRVRCPEVPAAQPVREPPPPVGTVEHLDLGSSINATSTTCFGKFPSASPLRAPGDPLVGFAPAAEGGIVLALGEHHWLDGRPLPAGFPQRCSLPLAGRAAALELLVTVEGRARLGAQRVAELTATYQDGGQALRPIAYFTTALEPGAALVPDPAGLRLGGRPGAVLRLHLDPARELRGCSISVLTGDFRLIVHAARLIRP